MPDPSRNRTSDFDFSLEEIRLWGGERQFIEALEQYANKGDVQNARFANGDARGALSILEMAVLNGDFDTAGNIMFLLGIGSLLEDWTHRKSVDDLAQRMALHVDRVWMKTGNSETLVPVCSA